MRPKKPAADMNVATSPVGSESSDKDVEQGEPETEGSASTSKVAARPPGLVMVKDAVKELDSRKGVSSQAIRNSIKLKYPTLDLVRLKYTVRKALIKGLENGTLVRPANSTAATGAQGRFRLAPIKATEPKQKTENADPNVEKPKVTKAGTKKAIKEAGTGKKKDDKAKGDTTETIKKTKKTDEATASKVAPAKKPKAKAVAKKVALSGDKEPKAKEPKAKAAKATKGKASVKDDEAKAVTGRRVKKTTV
ncbi:Protein B4 [Merluccius polli]|uniref:Protein B4 n=1 Tax=Merluccius polli TaxID=89951 RepID=A0AA47NSK8_MERPO|nr:Protein B4 [Merluccius polli]